MIQKFSVTRNCYCLFVLDLHRHWPCSGSVAICQNILKMFICLLLRKTCTTFAATNNKIETTMKKFFMNLVALLALMFAAPAAHATDWFNVLSDGGETIAVNPDISTSDGGKSYLVWVRNSFDLPESRAFYTRDRGYDKTVAYKLTLYKFTDDWNNFNIVQVSVYDEQGNIIDQYANPDMANTEDVIPAGSPIETVAEAAKVIYEIKNNPE